MRNARNLLLIIILSVTLSGCTLGSSWLDNFFGLGPNTGTDLVASNDAIFDLFQDTDTQYSEIFKDSGDGDLNVGDTNTSADGEVRYDLEEGLTFDPVYTEIGKMTPSELHGKEVLEIPVLMLGDNFFPFPDKQFGDQYDPELCDHKHHHGVTGYTLDGKIIPEPDDPCGFDNATKIMRVSGDEMIEWFHNRPRNF
ncbi:hypothetical protein HON36_03590 [Candidatus Parcubacteria bacterium]|jgi:hypothetical protein|nr:hypothetical protein [Candidatus Parcubacteria bacterium]MBT7227892.1 hypothetical protein [Candidatus Parcubacteria bacterium]